MQNFYAKDGNGKGIPTRDGSLYLTVYQKDEGESTEVVDIKCNTLDHGILETKVYVEGKCIHTHYTQSGNTKVPKKDRLTVDEYIDQYNSYRTPHPTDQQHGYCHACNKAFNTGVEFQEVLVNMYEDTKSKEYGLRCPLCRNISVRPEDGIMTSTTPREDK